VYSLGVVLYEMVTGVVPFTGDSPVAVAYKHVREEPIPPSQRNPDVPADLEQIILTALAKDPDHRYQTAEDMRADLLRFRRGRPLAAAPVTALIAEVPAVGAAVVGAGVAAAATMQQPAVAAAGVDTGPPTDEPAGRKSRALMWTLIVLGLVVVVGLIILFASLAGGGNDVTVPDVRNQPIAQATAALKAKGFKVTTDTAISTDVPEGSVIDQDPQPGAKAKEGSDVTLTVSGGAGQVNVPDVDNTSFTDAQQALTSEGFKVQRHDEASETVAKDLVIRTDPAGGTPANKGSTVQVFVSTGKEQNAIPDVTGLSEDDGFAQLGQAGFAVRTVSEPSSSVSTGKVTRTDPPAGTIAARGSTVRMFVSTGNPSVSVPNVIGQTEAEARSALSAKGLSASTITQVDPANEGKVIAQTPSGGAQVNPGSNVTLTIGGAAPATTTTTAAPGGP
jgi:serine/threonine-protein kinase